MGAKRRRWSLPGRGQAIFGSPNTLMTSSRKAVAPKVRYTLYRFTDLPIYRPLITLYHILRDIVEINRLAQPRIWRNVDKTLFVHRVVEFG